MGNKFILFFLFRALSSFVVQTFYVPDEYYQSIEIAHYQAFGYGYKTWEYRDGIRSYFYPFMFYVIYSLLKLTRLDYPLFIIYCPRIYQSFLSAISDYYFYGLCHSFKISSHLALWYIFSDWFSFYSGSRTLINTLEFNFAILCLYHFPWKTLNKAQNANTFINNHFFVLVSLIGYIRPTSLIVWLPFIVCWFFSINIHLKKTILLRTLKFGVLSFVMCASLDSYMYSQLVISPWNFLLFNIISGTSSFYGTHPIWWYIIVGLPVVMGPLFVPFIACVIRFIQQKLSGGMEDYGISKANPILFTTVASALFIYSLVPHKEFRFIHSLQPLMSLLALQYLNTIRSDLIKKMWYTLMAVGFIVPSVYFGCIHQSGTMPTMKVLANDARSKPANTSLLFLMPCHSTPLYTHLHVNVSTRFITCEPPIHGNTIDESDEFYEAPSTWLIKHWDQFEIPPTHIVMYDSLLPELDGYLTQRRFIKTNEIFHTFQPQGRIGRYIIIYRLSKWAEM